jgi:hypothetical protein
MTACSIIPEPNIHTIVCMNSPGIAMPIDILKRFKNKEQRICFRQRIKQLSLIDIELIDALPE